MNSKSLQSVRKKIDSVDKELQDLINQRAKLAMEVGKIKQKDSNKVIYRPEREAQILQQVIKRNKGPLSAKDLTEIFTQIMGKCRALQQPIKIALIGNKKSTIFQATKKHFDGGIKLITQNYIANVFDAVNQNKSDYGIVPIESLTKGVNLETFRAFLNAPLNICGEIYSQNERFLIIGKQNIKKSSNDKTAMLVFCHPAHAKRVAGSSINVLFVQDPATRIRACGVTTEDITFIANMSYGENKEVFFIEFINHKNEKEVLQRLTENNLKYISLGSYPKALI